MNKFVYFLAAGLAFAVLQVATVSADHEKACEGMTGEARTTCMDEANKSGPPPGEDPCMTLETQALKDACYAEHAEAHPPGTHAGMAPGTHTPADCGGVPCPTGDAEGMHPHHEGMEPPACAGGEAPMCGGEACPTPAQIAAGDHGGMAPGTEPMCNNNVPALCGDEACGPPPA